MPSRSERKVWRSLRRRKGRDATGWFLAEGPRLLRELLDAGSPVDVVLADAGVTDAEPVRDLLAKAREAGWRVETVERHVIEEIADTTTPQAVLAVAEIPSWGWDDLPPGSLVLLDGVQDPGNAGTLIRTSIALGASGVIALEGTSDPWGPKAVRASAGAGLRRPVFRADRTSTIAELRHRKLPLWVAEADGDPLSRGGSVPARLAIALGAETHGVSAQLEEAAARRVAIALAAGVESLNVAVAGALLLDRIMDGGERNTGGGIDMTGQAR